ncbi:MFS transporter [Actinomadura flavalba]|uniref:MFS transporter n=1 Tax=Actinomadura flavalba TaxID=1120938 RepID=UPI000366E8FB|nr:MFS transporter [Actinomadura flavalba]
MPKTTFGAGLPAVLAVAAATFTVVTTEMAPVGLLSGVAGEFEVSEGAAGLTMTVPGLVAAVAAPLVASRTAARDRRTVLLALAALLPVANLVTACAPSFAVLLVARTLVGVAIGGVWALAGGLAGRLVPAPAVPAATSTIFSGIAVASVLGVPAATLAGELAGWRWAFGALALLSAAVLAALALLLPALPPRREPGGPVREVLRLPGVRAGLVVTALLVLGHFAAYTYVRPVLAGRVDAEMVGVVLLAFGVAGVAGTFAAGLAAGRDPVRTAAVLGVVLAGALALVPWAGGWALVLWGLAYGGVSVTMQTWLVRAVPQAPEAGSALFVLVFNVAIAIGALAGGRVVDAAGTPALLGVAGVTVLAAAVTAVASRPGGRVRGAGPVRRTGVSWRSEGPRRETR